MITCAYLGDHDSSSAEPFIAIGMLYALREITCEDMS